MSHTIFNFLKIENIQKRFSLTGLCAWGPQPKHSLFNKTLLFVFVRAIHATKTKTARKMSHSFCPFQLYTLKNLYPYYFFSVTCTPEPRSGQLRTQKLTSHLLRTQSLNVLPLKPRVGQYMAIHATLTATDLFLAYFYPSGPFTCIFSKTSPDFSCVGCG